MTDHRSFSFNRRGVIAKYMSLAGVSLLVAAQALLSGCTGIECTRCQRIALHNCSETRSEYEGATFNRVVLTMDAHALVRGDGIPCAHAAPPWVAAYVQALALDQDDPLALTMFEESIVAGDKTLEVWESCPRRASGCAIKYACDYEVRIHPTNGGGALITTIHRATDGTLSWDGKRSSAWGFVTER